MSIESKAVQNEPGYLLGATLIALLVGLLVAVLLTGDIPGPLRRGPAAILAGAYLQAWGLMFLGAYYLSHKTFFFRALIWVCEHFSSPRGRGMAFFYFALAFGFGTMAMAKGLGIGEP
jgi:hypothetical protein